MSNSHRYAFYRRIVYGVLLLPLAIMFPRNRRKMVFGAWWGRNFSDNPKYFMKFMISVTGWECIWIGDERLRSQVALIKGAKFARKGSLLALWHCLTAKYYVNNVIWMDDIMEVPTCGRVVQINLWHGTALKRIGGRQYNGNGEVISKDDTRSSIRRFYGNLVLRLYNYMYPMIAYSSTGSQKNAVVLAQSWPQMFSLRRMSFAGQPRCDFLLEHATDKSYILSVKNKFADMFGISAKKRWYVYLPTWRHDVSKAYTFSSKDIATRLGGILNADNAIIIEKQHPKVLQASEMKMPSQPNVFVVSEEQANNIDVQELLLVADRLITDYSSCYFDYELLKRPIVHFDYDYQNYIDSDSGVEYDPRDVAGGPVVFTEGELLDVLAQKDDEILAQKGKLSAELINLETGHSRQSLFDMLPK